MLEKNEQPTFEDQSRLNANYIKGNALTAIFKISDILYSDFDTDKKLSLIQSEVSGFHSLGIQKAENQKT